MNAHIRTRASGAPRVRLEPDVDRIIAATGFLIKKAQREGVPLTQYDIVKSLFIADRSHLNKFGRLVTYDNYVAMKHGPVPSLAYDFLKLNKHALARHHLERLPWRRKSAEHLGKGCFVFYGAETDESETLSKSDIKALDAALAVVTQLSFGQVRELTHNDAAYKEAWRPAQGLTSFDMSLGLLFDSPDFEAAEDIQFLSRQRADNENEADGERATRSRSASR